MKLEYQGSSAILERWLVIHKELQMSVLCNSNDGKERQTTLIRVVSI